MIASWGLLAFLKAADTRQNASFAVRLDRKNEFEDELEGRGIENPEELFYSDRPAKDGRKAAAETSAKPSVENYTYSDRSDTIVKRPSRSKRSSSKKSIKYEDFSDDDFFRSFEEGKPSGAKTSGRSVSHDTEDEQPLTLDDIFGGDKK